MMLENVLADALDPDFEEAIRLSQMEANKGRRQPSDGIVDPRVVRCPECGDLGMNTCWGYWAFQCGNEILSDGTPDGGCGTKTPKIQSST